MVLVGRGAAVPRIKTAKSKKSQLWVFPGCPKVLGCVAGIFLGERGIRVGVARAKSPPLQLIPRRKEYLAR